MIQPSTGLSPNGGQSKEDSAKRWHQLLYNRALAEGWATAAMEPNGGESYEQALIRLNLLYFSQP